MSGGESQGTRSKRGCNTVHEILDPATGEVRDGPPLRAPDDATNVMVAKVGERLFAVGGTDLGANRTKPFLYEWAAPEPAPGQGDVIVVNNTTVNNVTNTHIHNTTVNHHVDVTNIIQHISNTTNVTVVNHNGTRVTLHHTEVNNVDVDMLALLESRRQCGFFDPDRDFFLRTRADGKDLVQVGTDESGKRRLIGRAAGDKGPAPRGRQGSLYLFHAESKTLVPFSTDDKGQFAVELPDAVKGNVYVFAMKDGEPSGAGILEIP